jgi:hypothetical protein
MSDAADKARDEIIDAIDEAVNRLGKRKGLELLNSLFDDLPTRINDFDSYYIGHTSHGKPRKRMPRSRR